MPPQFRRLAAAAGVGLSGGMFPPWTFSDVGVLMHLEGANGGTVFTDSSLNTHTVSRLLSTCVTSNTQAKFGSTSGYASAGDRFSITKSAACQVGNGDFTVEMFVYHTNATADRTYIFGDAAASTGANAGLDIFKNHTTDTWIGTLVEADGTGRQAIGPSALNANAWHHVVLMRKGDNLYLGFDGTMYSPTAITPGASVRDINPRWGVGGTGDYNYSSTGNYGTSMEGWVDEFRMVKGHAIYPTSGTYTVPTAAFPDV